MFESIVHHGVKRWKVALIIGYVVLSPIWGPQAEAAFHLARADGSKPLNGIHITGLITAPRQPLGAPLAHFLPRRVAQAKDAPVAASRPTGDDFWRRLANCESPNGVSGYHRGYFQFSPDTARKVGIDGSESYEEQRAAAQRWASMVSPGTTAGWPICWWRAQR